MTTPPNQPGFNKEAPLANPDKDFDQLVSRVVSLARDVRVMDAADLAGPAAANRTAQNPRSLLENSGKWLMLSDATALLVAFVLGGIIAWSLNMLVLDGSFQSLLSFDTVQQFAIYTGLGTAAIFWLDMKGHYRQRLPYWEVVGQIITVAFIGLFISGFIQFAFKSAYSRLWLGFSWVLFAGLLFTGRALVKNYLKKQGKWYVPALFIGNGPTAEAAARAMARDSNMGFSVIGQVTASGMKALEKPHAWTRLMHASGAGHLFLALEGGELEQQQMAVKSLVRERLPYTVVPPWLGLPSSTLTPHHFMMQDVMMLHNTNRLSLPLPRFLKRSFDVLVAGSALIALAPVLITVAVMVRRDGGHALFKQPRVGRGGKLFNCYKFRSMRSDAEAVLADTLAKDPEAAKEWQQYQKLKKDPRITPFGEFIRRTSIDELPQLLNVVLGDMSLVGPRPIMQGQESFYGDDFIYYEAVRPGISGPWQVSGRNKLTFKQRVQLEAWYARNWNLWMDIVILLKTVTVLLKKDQAF
jgi:undecaprenyl-phosphate galactose phosphotransferase